MWQGGLKRDGQPSYVGTIGTIGDYVLLLGELKVEKFFPYACVVCTCVALLAGTEVESSGRDRHQ